MCVCLRCARSSPPASLWLCECVSRGWSWLGRRIVASKCWSMIASSLARARPPVKHMHTRFVQHERTSARLPRTHTHTHAEYKRRNQAPTRLAIVSWPAPLCSPPSRSDPTRLVSSCTFCPPPLSSPLDSSRDVFVRRGRHGPASSSRGAGVAGRPAGAGPGGSCSGSGSPRSSCCCCVGPPPHSQRRR